MTKKYTFLFLLLAFGPALVLRAQPSPCVNPAMTSTCAQACVICDIDGFTGINSSQIQGQAPPGFCTTQVHHMQWIAFIAGSTELTLEVEVFNCQDNEGLEVGIYRSLNCQTFQLVSNCDTDIPPNTSGIFSNTVPLEVGQYYYFVMDGSDDDVCEYTIHVIEGTTAVPPLLNSGTIAGDSVVCTLTSALFTVTPPLGATRFEWSMDGVVMPLQTPALDIAWTVPGIHELCVTSSNACDTAAPACRTIIVLPSSQTQLAATICGGECVDLADTTLCDPGQYVFHFTNFVGCDSTVEVTITEISSTTTDLDLYLCDGDSVFIGTQPFFDSGQYQETLAGSHGCDSIVNLELQVILCQIQGALLPGPADCNGAASGRLQISIQNGTPPFQYNWSRLGPNTPSGSGAIDSLNAAETVDGLPAGTYWVVVTDGFGNSEVLFAEVTEPPALGASLTASQAQGFNLGCHGDTDGTLSLSPSGGAAPYQALWNSGAAGLALNGLGAGVYTATLTDANGCTKTFRDTLTEPPPLLLDVQFDPPGCAGVETGTARVVSASGGAPPYNYDLSGSGFGPVSDFAGLGPGPHTLTLRDASGCEQARSDTFQAPLIPQIDLGPDLTVDLGNSVGIDLPSSGPLTLFQWSASPGLSCYDCPEPEARPFTTTSYTLTVTAPGGCTASDDITVQVLEKRDIYVPNTFSPNDDGLHDHFTVYGGPAVARVRNLQVFSRWGELIFRQDDLPVNVESRGWNGSFRGKPLSADVFVWMAEVEYVDGVVQVLKGDVMLVK